MVRQQQVLAALFLTAHKMQLLAHYLQLLDLAQARLAQMPALLLLALYVQQAALPVAAFRPATATPLGAKVEGDFQCLKIPLELSFLAAVALGVQPPALGLAAMAQHLATAAAAAAAATTPQVALAATAQSLAVVAVAVVDVLTASTPALAALAAQDG